MRIIPAIDIVDGKCVRLTKGDYSTEKVYGDDPLLMAKKFQDHGIHYLHVVDLDGAKSHQVVHHKIVERICKETDLKVDFGGGIKTDTDMHIAFESGVAQVTVGSIAVRDPMLFSSWLDKYGSDNIILGADCSDRKIATNGWLTNSGIDVIDFISEKEMIGTQYVICTDISKDGMLQGPSIDLYKEIINETEVKLIASGGITSVMDLEELSQIGCEGAIIGKAIYENRITLDQLRELC